MNNMLFFYCIVTAMTVYYGISVQYLPCINSVCSMGLLECRCLYVLPRVSLLFECVTSVIDW